MEHVLMPIAIIGSFGTSLYFFTKVLTDYILKKKMIEKRNKKSILQFRVRYGNMKKKGYD